MTKKKTGLTDAKPKATTAAAAAATETVLTPGARQKQAWSDAMRLFGERRFGDAIAHFEAVAAGPDSQIADKARSYREICARKTSGDDALQLRTAEDHFNYGVERMNARDLQRARHHLERALALDPRGDHIYYTLALCSGFGGDGNGACENLKYAIALEPRNRILARQDAEFASLAAQFPALRGLFSGD